jgi:hypothetical protein
MLSCEQFRFLAGAAPRELMPMQRLHLLICRACSREYRQLKSLDERIEEALSGEPAAVCAACNAGGAASGRSQNLDSSDRLHQPRT